MEPQFTPTPEQKAQARIEMEGFRAHTRKLYTEQMPTARIFTEEIALLEGMLTKHWPKSDAKELLTHLIDLSWSCEAPYEFIKGQVLKALKEIEQGAAFIDFVAQGFYDVVDSMDHLTPYKNVPAEHMPYHELLAFEAQVRAKGKPSFKDSIKAMQKGLKKGEFPKRSKN